MLERLDERMPRALERLDGILPADRVALVVEWGAHLRIALGLQPSTLVRYLPEVGQYLAWLGRQGIPVQGLTPPDAEEWQKSLYFERRMGERARRVAICAVRRFYAWRETLGHGPSPARNLRGPKVSRRLPRRYGPATLRRLFLACDRTRPAGLRDYALLLFLYSTGARKSEVAGLTLGQLEMRERRAVVRFLGKGAKEREVSFEGPAVGALRDWLIERDRVAQPGVQHVFVTLGGGSIGWPLRGKRLEQAVQRLGVRAGVRGPLGLHRFRVTFATDLYDQGVDLERIRIVLGHEKIDTTRQYIAVSDRARSVCLSGERVRRVLGEADPGLPLWVRHKQQQEERNGS